MTGHGPEQPAVTALTLTRGWTTQPPEVLPALAICGCVVQYTHFSWNKLLHRCRKILYTSPSQNHSQTV